MRRITKRPWFGPKKYSGWGWRPIGWQGWVVSVLLTGLLVADLASPARALVRLAGAAVIVALWALALLLTGTGPGGPGL